MGGLCQQQSHGALLCHSCAIIVIIWIMSACHYEKYSHSFHFIALSFLLPPEGPHIDDWWPSWEGFINSPILTDIYYYWCRRMCGHYWTGTRTVQDMIHELCKLWAREFQEILSNPQILFALRPNPLYPRKLLLQPPTPTTPPGSTCTSRAHKSILSNWLP